MHKTRCEWCGEDELYVEYHDREWGKPVRDDKILFEFIILETFQAGLSWLTILRKRENFRKSFDDFDYKKIANYDSEKVSSLLQDSGIVRNRLKIKASIANAKAFMKIQDEFGSFSNYIWGAVENKPVVNKYHSHDEVPANTPLSDLISVDMKKQGFKFVGSTIIYAFLQAVGIVNDHLVSCFRHQEV